MQYGKDIGTRILGPLGVVRREKGFRGCPVRRDGSVQYIEVLPTSLEGDKSESLAFCPTSVPWFAAITLLHYPWLLSRS